MATAQEIINDVWAEVMAAERLRVLEEIAEGKAEKHRKTTIMPDGAGYRYYTGQPDAKGREVRWCYSTKRNAAGYFLAWREVWDSGKGEGFRDEFMAHKIKRNLITAMRSRATTH